MFSLCLVSPLISSIIRKLTPDQPNFIEVSSILLVAIIGMWSLTGIRILPKWISYPLLLWAGFQFLYALPSIQYDYRIGLSAIGTRILPMLMAQIAYFSIRSISDLKKSTLWITYLAIPFLAISLWVSIYGNISLPIILKPVFILMELGRDINKGQIYTASAIFSTPTVLGLFGFVVVTLALMNYSLLLRNIHYLFSKFMMFFICTSGILLAYLGGRRIALYMSVAIIIIYIMRGRKFYFTIAFVMITLLAFREIDNRTTIVGKSIEKRSDIILKSDSGDITFGETLKNRFYNVFLSLTLRHIEESWIGHFLGSRGQEALVFGYWRYRMDGAVEVGAAQLAYEMGMIGLILMPLVIVIVSIKIIKESRRLLYKDAVIILITYFIIIFVDYYTKASPALTTNQIHHYLFWSVPGICASLIEIGRRSSACKIFMSNNRKYNNLRTVRRKYQR